MVAACALVSASVLLGSATAFADDIDPEEYPPPPVEEEVEETPPPEPVAEEELAETGVGLAWQWVAAGGVGLLAVGSALVLVRRRFTHES